MGRDCQPDGSHLDGPSTRAAAAECGAPQRRCNLLHTAVHRLWTALPGHCMKCTTITTLPWKALVRGVLTGGSAAQVAGRLAGRSWRRLA